MFWSRLDDEELLQSMLVGSVNVSPHFHGNPSIKYIIKNKQLATKMCWSRLQKQNQ